MNSNVPSYTPSIRALCAVLLPAMLVAIGVYIVKFKPVHVAVREVKSSAVVAEVAGTGTLEARVKTTISARVQERLADVLVDQNDTVRVGQLLARLDDGELRKQVEVASATLDAAGATLDRVRVDEARAQAVEKQARLDHQRSSHLLASQVAAPADLDKATEKWRVAEADLKRTQAASVEAERQVVTAEKNLAFHKERLGYAEIRSPYDGLVVRRDRDPGGIVVPGSSILQLVSTNEIWVSAWVDETSSAALCPGQTARVVFRSEPNRSYPGAVARVSREADRETREFLVDVRLRDLPRNWTLGQRAEVYIETQSRADALAVPHQAVQWRGGKAGTFVHNAGKAQWRAITIGLQGRDWVEITEGLTAGDQVLWIAEIGKGFLVNGQRIALP